MRVGEILKVEIDKLRSRAEAAEARAESLSTELERVKKYKEKVDTGFTAAMLAVSGKIRGIRISEAEAIKAIQKAFREADREIMPLAALQQHKEGK